MIVQIDNTNAKAVVSGHGFKNDCPDRVNNSVNIGRNMGEIDTAIESGHRVKSVDIVQFNRVSGHASGHDCLDKPRSNGINRQSGQNRATIEKNVRYNADDSNDINQDNGHFIGHVR